MNQDSLALEQLALDFGEGAENGEFDDAQGDGGDAENGGGWVDEVEARRRSELARLRLEDKNLSPRSETSAIEAIGPFPKREGAFGWLEGYNELRRMGFGWRVAAYIAWASSPKVGRKPERVEDLATEVLGLTSARAIYVWKRRNPAIEEAVGMLQSAGLHEHRADVYKALIEMARTADYKSFNDRKLFFQLTGDLEPEKAASVVVNVNDFRGMSTEELLRIAGRAHPPAPAHEACDLKGRGEKLIENLSPRSEEPSDPFPKRGAGSLRGEDDKEIQEGEVLE